MNLVPQMLQSRRELGGSLEDAQQRLLHELRVWRSTSNRVQTEQALRDWADRADLVNRPPSRCLGGLVRLLNPPTEQAMNEAEMEHMRATVRRIDKLQEKKRRYEKTIALLTKRFEQPGQMWINIVDHTNQEENIDIKDGQYAVIPEFLPIAREALRHAAAFELAKIEKELQDMPSPIA